MTNNISAPLNRNGGSADIWLTLVAAPAAAAVACGGRFELFGAWAWLGKHIDTGTKFGTLSWRLKYATGSRWWQVARCNLIAR